MRTAWTTSNPITNPIVAWAKIVQRVQALPHCKESTKVYHFGTNSGTTDTVSNKLLIGRLWSTVGSLAVSAQQKLVLFPSTQAPLWPWS
jgi:hypothetical protein